MVIEHISPHSRKAACLLSGGTTQAFIRAQTPAVEGRKHRVENHTHFIVALQFYDSQVAIGPKLALFWTALCSRLCYTDRTAHSNKAAHDLIIV